ncbi:endonuclease/exonuclease/phosphatase family protein [Micromonospora sp. CPCC 205371]|nr:endonuclease/exonuclease/phosphatase family protein [Micromonospora sp. CPCC 205371]
MGGAPGTFCHARGPGPRRPPLIRGELARPRPDAIGLQEVLRDVSTPPTVDTCQALAIAHGTGYHVAYAPAAPRDGRGGIWQGNAVLSPWPIRTRHVVPLPGADEAEPRSLLYALVQTPLGDLPVFVTHLAWEPHHAPLRLRQAAYVAAHVDALSPPGALPAVLLGDFNAEPDSVEMKYLCDAGFADAWGDAPPGHTFDEANDYVRAAGEASCRIDYILVRGTAATPLDTRLAFTVPDRSGPTPVWPSDHFGVVTDLTL